MTEQGGPGYDGDWDVDGVRWLDLFSGEVRDVPSRLQPTIKQTPCIIDWSKGEVTIDAGANTVISAFVGIPKGARSYLTVWFKHGAAAVYTLTLPAQFQGAALTLSGKAGGYDLCVFWSDGVGMSPPVYGGAKESK
jgi:hypothetical protein